MKDFDRTGALTNLTNQDITKAQHYFNAGLLLWCGKQDLNLHEENPHKNLNLARLPIPPFPQKVEYVVDGDGFEPSKSETADLQSAPFGHSGTHP